MKTFQDSRTTARIQTRCFQKAHQMCYDCARPSVCYEFTPGFPPPPIWCNSESFQTGFFCYSWMTVINKMHFIIILSSIRLIEICYKYYRNPSITLEVFPNFFFLLTDILGCFWNLVRTLLSMCSFQISCTFL